ADIGDVHRRIAQVLEWNEALLVGEILERKAADIVRKWGANRTAIRGEGNAIERIRWVVVREIDIVDRDQTFRVSTRIRRSRGASAVVYVRIERNRIAVGCAGLVGVEDVRDDL